MQRSSGARVTESCFCSQAIFSDHESTNSVARTWLPSKERARRWLRLAASDSLSGSWLVRTRRTKQLGGSETFVLGWSPKAQLSIRWFSFCCHQFSEEKEETKPRKGTSRRAARFSSRPVFFFRRQRRPARRRRRKSWGFRLSGQYRFGIPFWLVGEFTTHFRTYFSGWIESDVHWDDLDDPWPVLVLSIRSPGTAICR